MSLDQEDAVHHTLHALTAAVATAAGEDHCDTVDDHMDALAQDGPATMLGAMNGWVEALRVLDPDIPDDGGFGLGLFDSTGAQVAPEGRVEPARLAASRIHVALLNRDLDSAYLLLTQAAKDGYGGDTVATVLATIAHQIHDHRTGAPR